MQEEWVKIGVDLIPKGRFIVTSLVQDADGVKIALDDEKTSVEIFFDGIPSMLRSSTEGIRMRTWGEVQTKYKDKSFFRNWFLFMVRKSSLTKWVTEESCNYYDTVELRHFCIVTSEELIDIIASFDPVIRVSEL